MHDALTLWRSEKQIRKMRANQLSGSGGGFIPVEKPPASLIIKIPRKGSGRGTPHNKLPRDNQRPVGRRKTRSYYICLRAFAAQSRERGWLNGKQLPRKVRS